MFDKSAILVVSGASGAGKSSLISRIIEDIGACYFSISTTTREKREGEVDGVDYHFVSKEEFQKGIKEKSFLEYALVHSNYYGTSLVPVEQALKENKLVIFDIDVQGNEAVVKLLGEITTSVFISPPSLEELEKRLRSRSTDSEEIIEKRVEMSKIEIQRVDEYDYLIVNDNLEEAAEELRFIAKVARLKKKKKTLEQFVSQWAK